ncbi:MAG: aminotransferase class V-fold PLP-dependent enzyme, partial [Acidobacteriota bacterium]
MRTMVEQAMARIVEHIRTLPEQPTSEVSGGLELAQSVRERLPESKTEYGKILEDLFEKWIPRSFNTASPGYLAYIPGGGLFHSAVADLIANATNRYVGVWAAAPALAELEGNVIRWFAEIVGYPPAARGILTSGGSLANFTAIVTARRNRLPEDFLSAVIYASDQVHHSVAKAAILAGFPERNVVELPSDERLRFRTDLLRERIRHDRAAGLTPFMVIGSAGTTNTGAVDDLDAIAEVAHQENLWFHVDAAYGGFFMLTDEGRRAMKGIERSDSVTLDPHKGLFLPYGTGSLLVKDGEALKRAHTTQALYMPPMQEDPELVDFCNYSPELSRDFRGLRVWLPIKMHGIAAFRRALQEKLCLTRWAADELDKIPGIEIVARPQTSVVAFRYAAPGHSGEELNELNRRLLDGINSRNRVFLTATTLTGRFVIRICVLSFRTHLDRMEMCLEDI